MSVSSQKLVFIGGGSGLSDVLPAFAAQRNYETAAIVSVFDDGGSSGDLRRTLRIPAVGDLRKASTATAAADVRTLLEMRLPTGHAIGNLALAFLARTKGFAAAEAEFATLARPRVPVVPVSHDFATLVGHFAGGGRIRGEHHFDHPPVAQKNARIARVSLTPRAALSPAAARLIRTANTLVVGPGSLFGSLLVHFAVIDFVETFVKSRARKILVAPGAHEWGALDETAAQIAARFSVTFDAILPAPKNTRWTGARLAAALRKIGA